MSDSRNEARINQELARFGNGPDPFAAAVRTTRMPMLITDPRRRDNPIVFVNRAFEKLTGYTRSEILGQNCRFLQGSETDPEAVSRIRDAVERRVPIEIELLNHRKDGSVFWNRLLVSPVFDEDGELTYFFASQFDVTLERDRLVRLQRDRDALEAEVGKRALDLSRSEERLRFTLQAGRLGSWTLDLDARRLMASDECRRIFGVNPGDPFGYDRLVATVHPDDRARMQAEMERCIAERSDYDIEYRIVTEQGETRWLLVRGQPTYRADGTPLYMAGVILDFTDRKRAEEHRDLLARELSHRVKNTLATVQSIARQTLRSAATVAEAGTVLEARIQSLAAANDVLTREGGDWATLGEVVSAALKPFGVEQANRFKIGGPKIQLAPRVALAFSLALHELSTNSVKYGALSADRGCVIVSWDIVRGSQPPHLWFQWEEVGGPEVAEPARKGFGSRMIEWALAKEISGTAEIAYRTRGLVFVAEAPLPAIVQD